MTSPGGPPEIPAIWLRSFYGFGPEKAGCIGWTDKAGRANMIRQAAPGDLVLIYGTKGAPTPKAERGKVLGVLQIDLDPIRGADKCAPEMLERSVEGVAEERWTFALPVRRAWRFGNALGVQDVASTTYTPASARVIALWCKKLTPEEAERVLGLATTEVPVWGEPPLPDGAPLNTPLRTILSPSRGVTPIFGSQTVERPDGEHTLYVARFEGDAAALLGRAAPALRGLALIKAGFSNDPKRRNGELNAGLPPAAVGRWNMWRLSAPYPNGAAAKEAEDALKDALDAACESLGGEFFLGPEAAIQRAFYAIPGVARFTIRA